MAEIVIKVGNRTVERYENNDPHNNSGKYTLYDKINKKPIVGIDPFRTIAAMETNDKISRSLKKRAVLSTNVDDKKIKLSTDKDVVRNSRATRKYFRKNIDPKSYIPQTFNKKGQIKQVLVSPLEHIYIFYHAMCVRGLSLRALRCLQL